MWSTRDLPDVTDSSTAARGRAHVRSGRVVAVTRHGAAIEAEVLGDRPYRIRLDETGWHCPCEVGRSGVFCEHCAAGLIAASELDQKRDREVARDDAQSREDEDRDDEDRDDARDDVPPVRSTPHAARAESDDEDLAPQDDGPHSGAAVQWLENLAANDLLSLLRLAAARVDGVAELLAQEYLNAAHDMSDLADDVNRMLEPDRSFLDFGETTDFGEAIT